MLFHETPLPGAYWIEPQKLEDERGFFARTFSREEFEARGLDPLVAQCSVSWNARKGTTRGLHYQVKPHAEAKVVHCPRGAIYDVIVDLRPKSPTYARWTAVELTADNRRMLYVPEGYAHGFQTLCDNVDVSYMVSRPYHAESARGIRWDDRALGIVWPSADPRVLSARDESHPPFVPGSAS